eukprot:31485-Pelagococcus_subviridis.AAC.12
MISGWSSKASDGVERHRGRVLKARDPGRRETTAKVFKDRRSPRRRGRMGTSVKKNAPDRPSSSASPTRCLPDTAAAAPVSSPSPRALPYTPGASPGARTPPRPGTSPGLP